MVEITANQNHQDFGTWHCMTPETVKVERYFDKVRKECGAIKYFLVLLMST